MRRSGFYSGWLITAAAAGMLLSGCGGGREPGEKVSGRVFLGKKPLPSGTVSFIADGKGGGVAAAQITSAGRYALEVPKGPYRITVTTPAKAGSPPPGTPDPQNTRKVRTVEIPSRYGDFGNSGLSVVVKKGPQTHDITLKPDPPPPPPPPPEKPAADKPALEPSAEGPPPSGTPPAAGAKPASDRPAAEKSSAGRPAPENELAVEKVLRDFFQA
jgi:hypothetical protein